jgi:hypothetical protein
VGKIRWSTDGGNIIKMNNTNFRWFRFNEVKSLDNESIKHLKKFSFSSFTPLFLYHFLKKGYDFIVVKVVVYSAYFFYLFLSSAIRSRDIAAKFKEIGPLGDIITRSQIEAAKSISNLDGSFGVLSQWKFLGSSKELALLNTLIFFVVYLLINVVFGFYTRRATWNRINWKDLASFNTSENRWNTLGLVSFMVSSLFLFYVIMWIIRIG